jgi:peptide chain release factor 2
LLDDASFALELSELEADGSDGSELASLLKQARASLQQLNSGLDKWELRMLLSGPYDEAGALVTITAGAGAWPASVVGSRRFALH